MTVLRRAGIRGPWFGARSRMASCWVLLALATATVAGQNSANAKTAALQQALERRLQGIAESVDAVMGYEVVDLTTGARFGRLQDEVFPTASTIKLAILYELFKQTDEGKLKLEEVRPLDRKYVVGGSGVLHELASPVMPLRDYATLMIVLSDNTATNVIIDRVGMQNVTSRMAALGLKQTKLRRRMIDIEAARRGDENVSTPSEVAKLLGIMYRGEGLSPESHRGLLETLKKSKSSPMRTTIPETVDVANKPGTLDGVAVDGGIVYVEGRPYIFAAMLTYLGNASSGDATIGAASRAVYEYFSRLATGSEYGRTIR